MLKGKGALDICQKSILWIVDEHSLHKNDCSRYMYVEDMSGKG